MTENELIKILKTLNALKPSEEFARLSRSGILSPGTSISFDRALQPGIFSRGISFAASLALAAVFMLVLTIGGIAGSLKTLFLPTLNVVDNESLVSEADTITNDINIHLSEIEYFEQTRQAVALAERPVTEHFAAENEIDRLLNEVIEY